jgi:hypothetical protein
MHVQKIDTQQGSRQNATLDKVTHNSTLAFGRLYPDRNTFDPTMFDPEHRINCSRHSVPNCYPANWKSELVQLTLDSSDSKYMRRLPHWQVLPTNSNQPTLSASSAMRK